MVDAVLISVDGKLVVEAYVEPMGRDELRQLNSVTKSVLAALVGIAAEERGLDPKAPFGALFEMIFLPALKRMS